MENLTNVQIEVIMSGDVITIASLEDGEIVLTTYFLGDEGIYKRKVIGDNGKPLYSVPELIIEMKKAKDMCEPDYANKSFLEQIAISYNITEEELIENIKRDEYSCNTCTQTDSKGEDKCCMGCSSNPYMDMDLLEKLKELM